MRDLMTLAALLCGVTILTLTGCVNPSTDDDDTAGCELEIAGACVPAGDLVFYLETEDPDAYQRVDRAVQLPDGGWLVDQNEDGDDPAEIKAESETHGHAPCDVWVDDGAGALTIHHADERTAISGEPAMEIIPIEMGDLIFIPMNHEWFDGVTFTCYADGDTDPYWTGMVSSLYGGEVMGGFMGANLGHFDGQFAGSLDAISWELVAEPETGSLSGTRTHTVLGTSQILCES